MGGDSPSGAALAISWNDSKKEKKGKVLALFMASAMTLAVMSPAMRSSMSEGAHELVSVIVRAADGGLVGAEQAVEQAGGEVGRELGIIDGFEATVPQAAVADLKSNPSVYEITPNGKVQFLQTTAPEYESSADAGADADTTLNAPSYGSLLALTDVIGADKYWRKGFTGRGVDVALIDTGVAPVEGLPSDRIINGPDLSFESQFPETQYLDTMGHGTHMAGIIGGADPGTSPDDLAAAREAFKSAQAAERNALQKAQSVERKQLEKRQSADLLAYISTFEAQKAACEQLVEPDKATCLTENDAAKVAFETGQQTAKADLAASHEAAKATLLADQEAKKAVFLEEQAAIDASAFRGVAPGSRILNVKVGQADGAADVSQVIAAIDWVVQHRNDEGMNVRVINMSFGTDGVQDYVLDPLTFAVENAWHNGIVVVAAAGNAGFGSPKLNNPAYDPYVIAVSAVDTKGTNSLQDDVVPDWTSRGNADRHPDLVAPGISVESLRVEGSLLDEEYPGARVGERFFKGTGTSQSAAAVSGAAALLLSRYPTLTPDQVKAMLERNARSLKNADPNAQGAGLLSLRRSYSLAPPTQLEADQAFPVATGTGLLDLSRGSLYVAEEDGTELTGEMDIFGMPFDGRSWSLLAASGRSWSGGSWNGSEWTGSDWSGSSWAGRSWSGRSWSGRSWSGRSWSGRSWSGRSWSGASWSGRSWSGLSWSGRSWSGRSWSGRSWSGLNWD